MYSFLAMLFSGDSQKIDRGPQVIAAFLLDQPRAEFLGRHVVDARLCQVLFDVGVDGVGLARHRERRQCRLGIFGRQRLDRAHPLGQGLGDLAGRAATAQMPEQLMQPRPLLTKTLSTMMSRYFSHWSTLSSPSRILLKPGPWACTRGLPLYCSTVAVPPKIRLRGHMLQHRGADVAQAGINGNGLFGDAGLHERLGHAVRCPRLLRAGLEDQADLHRE